MIEVGVVVMVDVVWISSVVSLWRGSQLNEAKLRILTFSLTLRISENKKFSKTVLST